MFNRRRPSFASPYRAFALVLFLLLTVSINHTKKQQKNRRSPQVTSIELSLIKDENPPLGGFFS